MKTGCCSTRHILQMENHAVCVNSECDNYLGITYSKVNYKAVRNTLTVSALTFCLLFTFDDFSKSHSGELVLLTPAPVKADKPDVFKVEEELIRQDVYCPDVVLAQVKIESGNFTSSLFSKTNNMIGMRYPFKRNTTAAGIYIPSRDTIIYGTQTDLRKYSKTMNYAVYSNWRDCIADYKLWQENSFNRNRHYITFLGNIYATDSLYMDKLRKASSVK